MSDFTHQGHRFAYILADKVQQNCLKGPDKLEKLSTFPGLWYKDYFVTRPANKLLMTESDPNLFSGGLWLELCNYGTTQHYQPTIRRAGSTDELAQKSFAIPKGRSSFFCSLDYSNWLNDTYVLIIRGEKHLLQWNFP